MTENAVIPQPDASNFKAWHEIIVYLRTFRQVAYAKDEIELRKIQSHGQQYSYGFASLARSIYTPRFLRPAPVNYNDPAYQAAGYKTAERRYGDIMREMVIAMLKEMMECEKKGVQRDGEMKAVHKELMRLCEAVERMELGTSRD